jgi:predicted metal-binding protein
VTKPNKVVVHVCTTCRAEGEALDPSENRAGARLFSALTTFRRADDPEVLPVECFSACRRSCALSFSAPGAWTYLCGDISADIAPQNILAAAALYREAPQGLIPWQARPDFLKKGVVARFPPLAGKEP